MKLVSAHIHTDHRIKMMLLFLLFLFLSTTISAQTWTLEQCIDSAKVNSKTLIISKNNVLISEQKNKEIRSNLIPKVNLNADYKYFTDLPYQLMPMSVFGGPEGKFKEAQFGVPHNFNTNLQVTMPLYNPQIYGGIQATKIASEMSKLHYEKSEENLFFEISNAYYNAQILDNQVRFIDSNLINSERLLSNIQLLRTQLMARETDVDKVELQIKQLKTQKSLLQSKYEQIRNMLRFLINVPENQPFAIEKNIVEKKSTNYSTQSTVEIRMIQTQNRLILSELKTLKTTRIPSLALIGSYGFTGYGYDRKPNEFFNFYPVGFAGIQMNYPLFNGMVTQRKIDQKKYELENNSLQNEINSEGTSIQIVNAKMQLSVSKNAIETSEQQVALAQKIYQQTLLQQAHEMASLTDVLLADTEVRQAQQNYLTALIDYMKADLELKKITGNFLNK
ncbi:MAG: TolC family protein [Crocinitomicaceae bacterium]|nr:TolC family protein [Crocinitomicaceae bacterium]